MVFDKVGTTTIVSQENITLPEFLKNLENSYSEIAADNIIINLSSFNELTANDIVQFVALSQHHMTAKKSFVLVTDMVSYDEVPDTINLVPTLQEAHDIIEMEEIERDLGI